MTTLEIVEQGTILRGTVGSTVHGLHHAGKFAIKDAKYKRRIEALEKKNEELLKRGK